MDIDRYFHSKSTNFDPPFVPETPGARRRLPLQPHLLLQELRRGLGMPRATNQGHAWRRRRNLRAPMGSISIYLSIYLYIYIYYIYICIQIDR